MMCFIDYAKAFDCVNLGSSSKFLEKWRIPAHVVDMVQSPYEFNSIVVRVDDDECEAFQAQQRVC